MQLLPRALTDLIDALGALPGVGPRSAERYAYFLLKNSEDIAIKIADTSRNLHKGVSYCPKTFALIEPEQTVSILYDDPMRDKTLVAVVADPFDIVALEKTASFKGTYHVLGGLISPIDGIGPGQLHINELVKRINQDSVKEVIIALNASVEGETTALYIQQNIDSGVKITKLAQGLPVGVDLEYADLLTLSRAMEGRTTL